VKATSEPQAVSGATETLLQVRNLKVLFNTDEGVITAIDGVDFEVKRGKVLGIVGESGSGKSVTTRAVMRLLPKNGLLDAKSQIVYNWADGQSLDVVKLDHDSAEMRSIRGGEISMIFQEPMASFSPVWTIGNQMIESIRLHRKLDKQAAREVAIEMLTKVGISNPVMRVDQYPHELSGGMRQRAMIAMALSTDPSLLIADEPTTALDVTIQAQILELMRSLQQELNMSIIFITHDIGVIAHVADEVAVMYLGKIVERGATADVIHDPKHPYTKGLISALPDWTKDVHRLTPVGGEIPSPLDRPKGCPFHPRCESAMPGTCEQSMPVEMLVGENRKVSCFLYSEPGDEA
jgi:peptide/nickel transport system ATP-binding protein